jgi:hypothetical protein
MPNVKFRPGVQPPQPARRRLRLADYLIEPAPQTPLPVAPASADWVSDVTDWPMYLNDQLGICGPAGSGHLIETITRYGQGKTIEVNEDDVLAFYEAVSGYRPGHPNTDVGVNLQSMLEYWQAYGLAGHEILAFGEVDISKPAEIQLAIDLFGGILSGINLPDSAEDQFNAGEVWDVVKGARIIGGHCVPFMGYGNGLWKGVTWAAVQAATDAFRRKYWGEGWFVITREWANAQGTTPTGIDLHTMGADFAVMSGQANPFPDVQPPAPQPTPAPDPAGATGAQVAAAVRAALIAQGQ